MRLASAVAVAAAALATACGKNPLMATVGDVVLAECDDVIPAEDGPTVVVGPETHEEDLTLPTGPVVRIAADRQVSWRRVHQLVQRLDKQGSRAVLLVGKGLSTEIGAFDPVEQLHPGTHLTLNATRDGQFCIQHPDAEKAYCVKAYDHLHIARTWIRDAMTLAVSQYQVKDVEVSVEPAMQWADVVRAIDGVRTCCPVEVRASLQP
jgi:hypothetical protein